jgi:uncharacterized protein (TIGR01777 family)
MKKILITGGTGFIGKYLTRMLLKEEHYVTIVTRSPDKYAEKQAKNRSFIGWDDDLSSVMNEHDVVINLVGENLFGQRWSDEVKQRIYNSRIDSTKKLVDAMRESASKPELFISASAVGIYGDSGDRVLDESSPSGNDFLAKVCLDWENESKKAEKLGVRVANPRIGIVLEDNGGMIEKMMLPFKFGVGGPIGSGDQYVPWVHMKDLCNALLFPMKDESISGPYNACSPEPETMNVLAKKMGKVLNRPSLFRVPEFVLNIALGEAAQPVLSSLRVQPKVLQTSGFKFMFEDLEEALADIL